MVSKKALITGITGQDGSYLAEFLLEKNYEVFGVVRRLSTPNLLRIDSILDKINIIEADLTDQSSLGRSIRKSEPDEIYNLAAQSFVATSWTQPVLTGDVTGLGVTRILDSMKQNAPEAKFYQASSSEMFGEVTENVQNENTRFHPRSPYGVSKVYAYWASVNYRESYGMFICNGIMFNHESPRRGIEFVTRKISYGVAKIFHGLSNELKLGNLDAKRDWGFAGDYVDVMWKMLQQDEPDDFVVATGESHSVKEFCALAFNEVGLDWEDYVVTDDRFMRPAEVHELKGDSSKARKKLGWKPKVSFKELVSMMVKSDINLLKPTVLSKET